MQDLRAAAVLEIGPARLLLLSLVGLMHSFCQRTKNIVAWPLPGGGAAAQAVRAGFDGFSKTILQWLFR